MDQPKEESVIVLDFLPNGYPFENKPVHLKTPVAQSVGKAHFTLLEIAVPRGVHLVPYEEVELSNKEKVQRVSGRLPMSKLSATAKAELNFVINEIIEKNEKRFVDFFNKAQPVSMRTHQLELLPGLGKKHMWEIIDAREQGVFTSFDDLRKRVHLMPDPKKIIARRIVAELEDKEKHKLFVL